MIKIGSSNRLTRRLKIDPFIFGASLSVLGLFACGLILFPTKIQEVLSALTQYVFLCMGGFFQGAVLLAMVLLAGLLVSPWGSIKLGDGETRPEFRYFTYFSMVFSAGIAAGIVYWGCAEAIMHYDTVPPGIPGESRTGPAAVGALQYTLFHWGISAWSIYLALGLPIAYSVYNQDADLRVSAVLHPFLGSEWQEGYLARCVDILSVVVTIAGITSTTGLVSKQFMSGIEYRWAVQFGQESVLIFMLALIIVFTTSAVTGIYRGIRRLSVLTVAGFGLLWLLVLILGPTGSILELGGSAVVGYVGNFPAMSTLVSGDWARNWTLFYWSWWFSWAPFVGLFIARISRGRTIREVILAGIAAPTLTTLAWFIVMGGTAINLQSSGQADILGVISESGVAASSFPFFDALVLGDLLLFVFLALIVVFLVTSADSSTLSTAYLTTRTGFAPSLANKVIWGLVQALLASLVILVGGAEILRSAAVLAGAPVAVLIVLAIVGLLVRIARGEAV